MANLEDLTETNYHKGKHDTIVKKVVSRLEDSGLYDCIKHNVPYQLRNGEFGEADVLARSGSRYFAFEVKSSPKGSVKAGRQLVKDKRFLQRFNPSSVYEFHVYCLGKSFDPVYIRKK